MINLQQEKIKLMKERNDANKPIINVINDILTDFKKKAVDIATARKTTFTVEDLTEADKLAVVKSVGKRLNQEIDSLKNAGRDYTTAMTQKQFVDSLLPQVKTFDEMKKDVDAVVKNGASTVGDVMKHFKSQTDQYDMKALSQYVKTLF